MIVFLCDVNLINHHHCYTNNESKVSGTINNVSVLYAEEDDENYVIVPTLTTPTPIPH